MAEYFCVIDFECTCEGQRMIGWQHEIIEFPCVLVHAETKKTVAEFHSYVRPTQQPQLTKFCKKLTGITQKQVDSADTLDVVLHNFDKWLKTRSLINDTGDVKFVPATDGPWDLENFLAKECKRKEIPFPEYLFHWVDIRHYFKVKNGLSRRQNISKSLELMGVQFEGREHSGIDDSRNIARILIYLLERSEILTTNDFLYNPAKEMNYRGRQRHKKQK